MSFVDNNIHSIYNDDLMIMGREKRRSKIYESYNGASLLKGISAGSQLQC